MLFPCYLFVFRENRYTLDIYISIYVPHPVYIGTPTNLKDKRPNAASLK